MGQSVTVQTGWGVIVPPEVSTSDDERWEEDGFGEWLWGITDYASKAKYPDLTYGHASYMGESMDDEYDEAAFVLFPKSTHARSRGVGVHLPANGSTSTPLFAELQQLQQLADDLGIPSNVEWYTVVSYG